MSRDEFWNYRVDIGRMEIEDGEYQVWLRVHTSEEQRRDTSHEIAPVRSGKKIYVMAKPYFIYPEYSLQVELYPEPREKAIGEVTGFEISGVGLREMGNAQAWNYPDDEALILWECYLYEPYRGGKPKDDERLNQLWDGFEGFLIEKFDPTCIYTPSWEPIYEQKDWEEFLESRGYERFNERSFKKVRKG